VLAARRGYAVEAFRIRPGLRRFVIPCRLLLVAMIFVGIRAGVFTAIEAASPSSMPCSSPALYRRLTRAVFVEAYHRRARTSGLILFVIGAAASVRLAAPYLQVPAQAVRALSAFSSRIVILLLMIVLLLLLSS
jgi:TRAP-type C4-dicarboxylate transport system permease large subunit